MIKIKEFIKQNNKILLILLLIIISATVFTNINMTLKKHEMYELDISRKWDRFFSYDDFYYAHFIFNNDIKETIKLPATHIKHPMFALGGHFFTRAENLVFPNLSFTNHYHLIMIFQNFVSIVGIVFMFLILYDCIKIKIEHAFLLSLIFMFSSTVIIASSVIESFIFSSTLLILSFYCLFKKKYVLSGILGVLIWGVTITNVIIWGTLVLFLIGIKDYKNWVKVGISFLITLLLVIGIVYLFNSQYITEYIVNFNEVIKGNTLHYEAKFGFLSIVKHGFHYLFMAVFFYIDTINFRPNGSLKGQVLFFEPSANLIITVLSVVLFVGMIILLIKPLFKEKNKNVLTCVMVIIYNLFLHCGLRFGLHEGFLYAPHILFAYIILLGLIFKYNKKYVKYIRDFVVIMLTVQLCNNFRFIEEAILVIGKAFIK